VFEPYGFAASDRKDEIGADLFCGSRDIGEGFETGVVELQDVAPDTGLEVSNDVVSVARSNDKGVAASRADKHIIAAAPVDHVVAGVPGNNIVEIVTGRRGRIDIAEFQVFDVWRIDQAVAVNHPSHDGIDTFTSLFDDLG